MAVVSVENLGGAGLVGAASVEIWNEFVPNHAFVDDSYWIVGGAVTVILSFVLYKILGFKKGNGNESSPSGNSSVASPPGGGV